MEKPKIEPYFINQTHNNSSTSGRKKKLQIITGNKVISLKKQSYNQNNPYSLPNEPRTPNPITKQTTFVRDTLTQTSSQKSVKILRTNGMRIAEKPNIGGSRIFQQREESAGNLQMRSLQQQNMRLRQENMMLNERLRYLEENHKREIGTLNGKMQKIFRQTGELEEKVRISDREWNKYMQTYNGY